MSCNPYSLIKQLIVAARNIRDACARAFKYIGVLHADDARATFLTILRHAFYDWCKRNGPPEIAHDDGAAIMRVIDDDGLPACRALPWLPIPRGLGHALRGSHNSRCSSRHPRPGGSVLLQRRGSVFLQR